MTAKKSTVSLNGCTQKSLRVLLCKTQLPLAREPLKPSRAKGGWLEEPGGFFDAHTVCKL